MKSQSLCRNKDNPVTTDRPFSPTMLHVRRATHATDAGVLEQQRVAGPCALLGTHHGVWRRPPANSQHRVTQNEGSAGLAGAGIPTPQVHRDVPQQRHSRATGGLAVRAAQ